MQTPVRADDGSASGSDRRGRTDGGRESVGTSGEQRVLVLNPASGSGDHAETVRDLATERGFTVRETEESDDAIDFAAEAAANGASLVAAAGGDGTVNQVVRGIHRADGFGEVTLGVVPAGTGNNFAANIGIEGIERAFEIIETGERRALDVGVARTPREDEVAEMAFVNSCVAGLTAESSVDAESKSRLGVLAYVFETLRRVSEFESV